MNRHRLVEIIDQGESSTLEFKRDGLSIQSLAKELVAFLNLEGGTVLIGVEDDGSISGISCAGVEEWVAEACRTKIESPVIDYVAHEFAHVREADHTPSSGRSSFASCLATSHPRPHLQPQARTSGSARPLTSGTGGEDGWSSASRGDPVTAVGANPSDHFQQLVVIAG